MLNPIMSQHIYLRGAMDKRVGLSNPKVVGLNPTVGAYYYILGKVEFQQVICFPWDCHVLNGRISCVRPMGGIQTHNLWIRSPTRLSIAPRRYMCWDMIGFSMYISCYNFPIIIAYFNCIIKIYSLGIYCVRPWFFSNLSFACRW